jgi:hypothetical protein
MPSWKNLKNHTGLQRSRGITTTKLDNSHKTISTQAIGYSFTTTLRFTIKSAKKPSTSNGNAINHSQATEKDKSRAGDRASEKNNHKDNISSLCGIDSVTFSELQDNKVDLEND